jgi:uncharacterized phiE125 gp8 family phage protein
VIDIKVITDVSVEPVTIEEAYTHCRIDTNSYVEDNLILALITTAREYCESHTRRALATKTLELILNDFPKKNYIELPCGPVQSITSIKYKDSSGTETTWSSAYYNTNIDSTPAIITPIHGGIWANFIPYPAGGAVRIRYVTGHKSDGVAIPKSIKQAMLLLIGHLYENREATNGTGKPLEEVPFSIHALLNPYKIARW